MVGALGARHPLSRFAKKWHTIAVAIRTAVCAETSKHCVLFTSAELADLPPGPARGQLWAGLVDAGGRLFLVELLVRNTAIDVRAGVSQFMHDARGRQHAALLELRPGWSACFALTTDACDYSPRVQLSDEERAQRQRERNRRAAQRRREREQLRAPAVAAT